ncbi:MAG TPA: AIPR family protein [Rhodopila sp.]|uniref:AIPR family protein n=1 Tax=Rhodopila sp. TaxID=2480087 RepID=UPI002C6A7207|nr:AIPR family protein [Rhodopila sp.]HVY17414.1 AIPR family protein [Rhodopila sp.]
MAAELDEILKSVDELAVRGKISRQRAFAAWFAINFFGLDEDDALEAAAADGGNDQGIDIAFADETSQELIVIQAHCPQNLRKITPKSKWDALIASLPFVADPESLSDAGRPDLAESLLEIRKIHPDYPVSVGLITLGLKSDSIEASLKAHESQEAYEGFNYFYFPQQDIINRYRSLVDSEAGIPEDILHFSGAHFEDSGAYGRAWVGSISAAELKRLHSIYQDRLFAGNVRLFIGARKGGINEQIIKTAKEDPGNFWALNNGITIVADTATPGKAKDSSSTLEIKRFSIVNGCQTTSSLVRADAGPTAKVLARVIAAKATLRNEIVRYNNSQNAVKIWTVRAVDDIQNQLRREFSASNINYAPKQEGARKTRNTSIIELDKVTQYLAASQESFLIQAIDNKAALFDQPYQKLFRRGIKTPEVYLAWLTGSFADEERQKLVDGLGDDTNSGLLGVASGYWIIFCAYKLMERLSDVKSSQITLERMKSVEFSNALRKYVKMAATMFYDAAVDTYDREEYGSFKSTLRSVKFFQRINSKINSRIARLEKRALPDLVAVCRTAKIINN